MRWAAGDDFRCSFSRASGFSAIPLGIQALAAYLGNERSFGRKQREKSCNSLESII
jgi:hypothetical protein